MTNNMKQTQLSHITLNSKMNLMSKNIIYISILVLYRGKVCNFDCLFVRDNLRKDSTDFENSFAYM